LEFEFGAVCLVYIIGRVVLVQIDFQVFQFLLLVVILAICNTCHFVSFKYEGYPEIKDTKWVGREGKLLL
jgi:hypothetical protein